MKTITCIDQDKNTYEVPISDLRWRPSAYGILIQDDHILLVPQWDGYDLPGGGIEIGETIEEGLIREIKEETGLDARIDELVDYKTSFFKLPHRDSGYCESILFYHRCRIIGGQISTDGFDQDEKEYARLAEWIPLSEIENITFKSSVNLVPIIKKATI